MQKTEIKKEKGELIKQLAEKRERLQGLRFDLISGKLKSAKEIRSTRKEIARILTAISAIDLNN